MTPADTLRVAAVGDPQIAPDGGSVVYTVSTVEGNATRTALMLVRANDVRPAPEALVTGEWNVSRPRWSPDGRRVAFLAAQGQQTGLWVVSLT
ncbi:MAG: S9 family peptidase, partial [Acidobacteria bacterium]|nr:S9 family peptidase [Acidobacteriota bacterium]